jgi:hypothetical protein
MKRSVFIIIAALVLSLFAFACAGFGSGLLADQEKMDINKPYGGLTAANESVAFGDAELQNKCSEEQPVDDPISNSPDVSADLHSSTVKAYLLRIKWGYLNGNEDASEITNWSGSVSINNGTLVILRTIRFDVADQILLPRTSAQKVEFTSFTQHYYDGLALAIIDKDTSLDPTSSVVIKLGSYEKEIPYSSLGSLEILDPVGDKGQEVSIESHMKDFPPFKGGFLDGRWIDGDNDNDGIFKGRWINSIGTVGGFVRGIWGVNSGGQKIFYGKYIDMNGDFMGFISGFWTISEDGSEGDLEGNWVSRNMQKIGKVRGHYKFGPEDDSFGVFFGMWFTL